MAVTHLQFFRLCRDEIGDGENIVNAVRDALIIGALREAKGCQAEAARLLGVTKKRMNDRLRAIGERPIDRRIA